jgi:hypothetical protein
MALIKCHECGGQISDHARICPQCGAPVIVTIKRRRKVALIGLGIRLVFATVICIALWFVVSRLKNQTMIQPKAVERKH